MKVKSAMVLLKTSSKDGANIILDIKGVNFLTKVILDLVGLEENINQNALRMLPVWQANSRSIYL